MPPKMMAWSLVPTLGSRTWWVKGHWDTPMKGILGSGPFQSELFSWMPLGEHCPLFLYDVTAFYRPKAIPVNGIYESKEPSPLFRSCWSQLLFYNRNMTSTLTVPHVVIEMRSYIKL